MHSVTILACVGAAVAIISLLVRSNHNAKSPLENDDTSVHDELKRLKAGHETGEALFKLVHEDGAGAWPPRAVHRTDWPHALRAYHDIYLELVPLLSHPNPSLDDEVNKGRCSHFRGLMRDMLATRVRMADVEAILMAVEADRWDESGCGRAAYNGFYCCIAVLRHAYRWAAIPVVKVAQQEKVVDFPSELDRPWAYLQRHFGMNADSGNNTANVLHNFNESGERVYRINVGSKVSDLVRTTEDSFFRLFLDVEVAAYPIYRAMVHALVSFSAGDKAGCLRQLQGITVNLRQLLRVFCLGLTEARVAKSVWLSYVQGFQGWGCGRMVDGRFVEYDGLSGSHTMCFQALDAFLGMDRYMNENDATRYVSRNQRSFCLLLRAHSFAEKLHGDDDSEILDEIRKIVAHLKTFRAAHRNKVMPYLAEKAPERVMMTAGKSFMEPAGHDNAHLKGLDRILARRLEQTAALGARILLRIK